MASEDSPESGKLSYKELMDDCLAKGCLYEDPDFKTDNSSLFSYKKFPVQWKRPQEICDNPQFIVEGATKYDLDQGNLGNCWYVAAVACLTTQPTLFKKVVPLKQSFTKNYAGIFRFRFWQWGKWVEVVVDDRLPVMGKVLSFCHNIEEPNEFWAPLMEKAYAKLYGSYGALEGGKIQDALVDFTAGAGMAIEIQDNSKGLFRRMSYIHTTKSLMGCSIARNEETDREALQGDGLWQAHAYSLVDIIKKTVKGKKYRILGIRNPHGRTSWKPECDKYLSKIPEEIKKELGIVDVNCEGEFWISYEYWLETFTQLQVCFLGPESIVKEKEQDWSVEQRHGSWLLGGNYLSSPKAETWFWSNPQYHVTVTEQNATHEHHLVVDLMQKNARRMRGDMFDSLQDIAYYIYKVKENAVGKAGTFTKHDLGSEPEAMQFSQYREACCDYTLKTGHYCIIPAAFRGTGRSDYFFRLFFEGKVDLREIQDKNSNNGETPCISRSVRGSVASYETSRPMASRKLEEEDFPGLKEIFHQVAGEDKLVSAREMRKLLKTARAQDVAGLSSLGKLSKEACRNVIKYITNGSRNVMDYNQVVSSVTKLGEWQRLFDAQDTDKTGTVDVKEITHGLKSLGFKVSRKIVACLLSKYAGKRRDVDVDDYVICICKFMSAYETFTDKACDEKITLTLEEWLETSLTQ